MNEDARNTELSRAYRDLATESTPAELDDRVLQMAARETRSRYGIARAWVRPIAWAATIGLSLAIVLEVMQVIPPASEPESAPRSEPVVEIPAAEEAPARLQQEAGKREDTASAPGAVVTSIVDSPPANPGGGGAEELGARRAAPPDLSKAKESPPAELDDADAFAADDIRILEEAEVQARQRAGEPGIAAFAASSAEAVESNCDEAARETPESWHACIEALRESGERALAAVELEALREAFPDFEVPASNR